MGQRDHIFIKSCELGTQPSKCHKKAVYSSKRNNLGSEQLIALLNEKQGKCWDAFNGYNSKNCSFV